MGQLRRVSAGLRVVVHAPSSMSKLWSRPLEELLPLVPECVLVTVRKAELDDVDAAEPELGSAPRVPVRLNVLKTDPIGFQQVSQR